MSVSENSTIYPQRVNSDTEKLLDDTAPPTKKKIYISRAEIKRVLFLLKYGFWTMFDTFLIFGFTYGNSFDIKDNFFALYAEIYIFMMTWISMLSSIYIDKLINEGVDMFENSDNKHTTVEDVNNIRTTLENVNNVRTTVEDVNSVRNKTNIKIKNYFAIRIVYTLVTFIITVTSVITYSIHYRKLVFNISTTYISPILWTLIAVTFAIYKLTSYLYKNYMCKFVLTD